MSDVRALLKAKRQETRVTHPLASYSVNGQLRCLACGTIVKHASSWEGHVGSKAHRVNAAKLREEEQRRATTVGEGLHSKRKADENAPVPAGLDPKRRRLDGHSQGGHEAEHAKSFPADFFSDPGQAPGAPAEEDEEDEEEGEGERLPTVTTTLATATQASSLDLEWENFQKTVLNPPDEHETYERATVFAEPVAAAPVLAGFPPLSADVPEAEPEEELTEEQKRQRKEQEERELIMDRLLEEERAQEEADAKVAMLKNRLETLRMQREAKKAAKGHRG